VIISNAFQGKAFYVVGWGRTGLSAAQSLKNSGARVFVWDDNATSQKTAQSQGFDVVSPQDVDWSKLSALVLSPGIPHTFPKPHLSAQLAQENHVPILCDVDLLAQALPQAQMVGITGTNGKSTTTALMSHLLKGAGLQVQMGGNIGVPVLDLEDQPGATYVLELSSYQLERTPHLTLDTAVLLNITPDHIDRHGDLAGYVQAKRHIFQPQGSAQDIVIGVDTPESEAIFKGLSQDTVKRVVPMSTVRSLDKGVYIQDGFLVDGYFEDHARIYDLRQHPYLKGQHNWENILAAYGVVKLKGLTFDVSVLEAFQGLVHRQELCGIQDNVHFINDSKATNIESTLRALAAYENIYLILGGQPKESLLQGIETYTPHIQKCYLIGEAQDQFAKSLDVAKIPFIKCGDLKTATQKAYEDAVSPGNERRIVMLSPACASFDQFKDFEDRGNQFKMHVEDIIKTKNKTFEKAHG